LTVRTTNPPKVVLERLGNDERVALMRALCEQNALPFFRVAETATAATVRVEGREVVMLGSANYLGLANHRDVVAGARAALDRFGATITGSRLLNGTIDLHIELEEELADWHGTDAAIVFTTGYQANLGAISALVGAGDTIVVDSAAHASILDGCGLSRAKIRAFRHNRLDLLEDALQRARNDGGAVLVVVDGLYSMEGDLAPLDGICELCRTYGAALMVDEAHSVGLLGEQRTGAVELFGVEAGADVRMGSLSKGLGSTGGFVCGSHDVVDALRINARPFLFTTAAVPATLGAALAGVRVQRSDEGRRLAARALDNARRLRDGLEGVGVRVGAVQVLPDGSQLVSPIVPVHVGDDLRAIALWRALFDRGVFTSVALHPAVPPTGALLRLCVMATHSDEHLQATVDAFAEAWDQASPCSRRPGDAQ
jgi:8-amino-7-oxononanoate synthase